MLLWEYAWFLCVILLATVLTILYVLLFLLIWVLLFGWVIITSTLADGHRHNLLSVHAHQLIQAQTSPLSILDIIIVLIICMYRLLDSQNLCDMVNMSIYLLVVVILAQLCNCIYLLLNLRNYFARMFLLRLTQVIDGQYIVTKLVHEPHSYFV